MIRIPRMEKTSLPATLLFFAGLLVLGILIFRDYGLSWDEPVSRSIGETSARFVTQGDQTLFASDYLYTGPIFEIICYALESVLGLDKDAHSIYFLRHLLTFLCFCAGVFFFYLLCKDRFQSGWIALVGCLFLVLSPRIFAHAFYNSRDIPFLTGFIAAIYTLTGYLKHKNLKWTVFHAVACAFLIAVRILGIMVVGFTLGFLLLDLCLDRDRNARRKKAWPVFFLFLFLCTALTVFFWPVLWTNPVEQFIAAFKQMSHFPWARSTVLYLGELVEATRLPWHYIHFSLVITTPLIYSALFALGSLAAAWAFIRNPIRFHACRRDDLIFALWLAAPIASVILLESVVYDGWRHLFFVYPAFLIFALMGLTRLWAWIGRTENRPVTKGVKAGVAGVVILCAVITAVSMVRYHPFQNVYYNRLAGADLQAAKQKYELDYWGLSYRKGLEWILKEDSSPILRICVANHPGWINRKIINSEDRKRLEYVKNVAEADYFLGNYRWHRDDYGFSEECHSIIIDGAKIMTVYRLEEESR